MSSKHSISNNATFQQSVLPTLSPQHAFPLGTLASCTGAMGTAAYALVSEWWHRYRSRLELASYSDDQRKDLRFSADVDGEIAKPFWKK
jgi:uncharacterized protein YjiS (DUF1127 family)